MTSEQLKNEHIAKLRLLCSAATLGNQELKETLENIIDDFNECLHNLYKTTNKFRKGIQNVELGILKDITYEPRHGFVLTDINDSIYFTEAEAIEIAKFIKDNHNQPCAITVHELPK